MGSFDITIGNDLIVNVAIHCCILFIFLYFFFYFIISKKGEHSLELNISTICDNNMPIVLNVIDMAAIRVGHPIDWKETKIIAQHIMDDKNNTIEQRIYSRNEHYKWVGIWILISLVVCTFLLYMYQRVVVGASINLTRIFQENIATFLLIGMIEYIFFEVVASEYTPAYPSTIGQTVLERVKTNIKTL